MDKIKVRDFQRNLYALVSQNKEVEVVNLSGQTIGYFVRNLNPVLHASPEVAVYYNNCFKCLKPLSGLSYSGEAHNDIGEFIQMDICEACYKKFKPPKFRAN